MACARREGASDSSLASHSAAAQLLSFSLYTYTAPPVSTAPPPTGEGGNHVCTTYYTAAFSHLSVTSAPNFALCIAMRRRCHPPTYRLVGPGSRGGSLPAPKSPTFSGQGRANRPVRAGLRVGARGPCWAVATPAPGLRRVAGRPFGSSAKGGRRIARR